MKFQKFEISFLIFGSILVVLFNVILVALKVLVVFEIFKETSNKFAVKFLSSRTVHSCWISWSNIRTWQQHCKYFDWQNYEFYAVYSHCSLIVISAKNCKNCKAYTKAIEQSTLNSNASWLRNHLLGRFGREGRQIKQTNMDEL